MDSLSFNDVGLCSITKEEAAETLSWAFLDDTFHRYVIQSWNGRDHDGPVDITLNRKFFAMLLTQLEDDGAFCLGIHNSPFAIVCQVVEVKENTKNDEMQSGDVPAALLEMEAESNAVLRGLFARGQKVLHIFLVGKNRCSNGYSTGMTGSVTDLLLSIARVAASQGWPLYLEATSPHSRDIFKSVGFEVIREIKVGVGRMNEQGMPTQGGHGVSLWIAVLHHS